MRNYKIKNWKKFNESSEYEGPMHVRDLLLDPWIDNRLCDTFGGDHFMTFEFHNIKDFNDAKEVLQEWNMDYWTEHIFSSSEGRIPSIIAWNREIQNFVLGKLKGCEEEETQYFRYWKKGGKKIMAQETEDILPWRSNQSEDGTIFTEDTNVLYVDNEIFSVLESKYSLTEYEISFFLRKLLTDKGIIQETSQNVTRVYEWNCHPFNTY